MAGLVNDNIVFPVLDLIRAEMRKMDTNYVDPFLGYPSVELYREHQLDPERVTGAQMVYESGYIVDVFMKFGSDDETTYPDNVSSYDYDYYKYFRLTETTLVTLNPDGDTVASYNIVLNYNNIGLLTGTDVSRIR